MNHSLPGSPELVTVDKPLELGRHGRPTLRLKNRIVTSPMERNYGTSDGRPTEQYLDYLRARAVAGAGLITTEATFVREDGRGRTHQLGLHTDAVIASHRRLTDELHAAGALVAVELNHGGRTAQAEVSGHPSVAPSPIPCAVAGGEMPRELTTAQCRELVDAFAEAARRAVDAGYDVINLHGGHGYLIHQFMSPRTNQRSDEYAVPERFANEVIAAVRRAAPTIILGIRISVVEGVEDGLDAETTREIVGRLDLDKLDFLDLSAGSYEAGEWIVQSGEWSRGFLADLAASYRDLGLPIGMAGRLNTVDAVKRVLAEDTCDFVSLGRAVHADPDFIGGLLHGHRFRPCIACNVCIDNLGVGQVTCTVNPQVGRSRVPVATGDVTGRRIAVVGAGPSGLTAALELSRAGAEVTIYEASDHIGGDLAFASTMRSTPEFPGFMTWMQEEIEAYGMDLRLDSRISPEDLADIPADGIVLATGGIPQDPGFDTGAEQTIQIREWLKANPDALGSNPPEQVTIWGSDSVAMSVADTLASRGTKVLLIGDQETIAPEAGRRAKILAVPRLQEAPNVTIMLSSRVISIDDGEITIVGPDGEYALPTAGPVLVSRSTRPLNPAVVPSGREAAMSRAAGKPVVLAGTVVETAAPIVSTATKSGYDAAQRLAHRICHPTQILDPLTTGVLS